MSTVKLFIYVTGRSKAVVSVLFLFCVALWFILRGALRLKVLPCSLFSYFFIPFSIVITSLDEEGAGLCASPAFVCFARVSSCHFSLPLGVRGWLRFVALPGRFYYNLFKICIHDLLGQPSYNVFALFFVCCKPFVTFVQSNEHDIIAISVTCSHV